MLDESYDFKIQVFAEKCITLKYVFFSTPTHYSNKNMAREALNNTSCVSIVAIDPCSLNFYILIKNYALTTVFILHHYD